MGKKKIAYIMMMDIKNLKLMNIIEHLWLNVTTILNGYKKVQFLLVLMQLLGNYTKKVYLWDVNYHTN